MSLSSLISDLCRSLTVSDVQAEATPAEERVESQSKEESKEEEPEAEQGPEKKDEEGGEEEEKEKEEEDDDEEPQDPAPAIMKDCSNTKECKPHKHHYDECVERVTTAVDGSSKEDCIEEFFHVLHCANTCAAPKLWSKLK